MHIADLELGILGATGIVGAGLCIAPGAALAFRLKRSDQICLCFFGDGASNTGTFHEGINLAAIWNLPVVYVCQNNHYAESTSQTYHQKICDIGNRGSAYGIPGVCVDGNDVVAVYEAVLGAVERGRKGLGPTLIECKTYRWLGHYVGDPGAYRPKEEVTEWKERDPLVLFRDKLLKTGVCSEEKLNDLDRNMEREIDEAVAYAQKSPAPEVRSALEDIYVSGYIP